MVRRINLGEDGKHTVEEKKEAQKDHDALERAGAETKGESSKRQVPTTACEHHVNWNTDNIETRWTEKYPDIGLGGRKTSLA